MRAAVAGAEDRRVGTQERVGWHEILEQIADATIDIDERGRIVRWSAGAERLLRWNEKEAQGAELAALALCHGCRERFSQLLLDALARREKRASELELRRADGQSLRALAVLAPAADERGGLVLVLRELEQRRRGARQRERERLESLGLFAGGIAHDFNNLLLTVIGHAALARRELPADGTAQEHLTRIEHAARQATELTRQLLAFAGRGSFHPQLLELDRLLELAVEELQGRLPQADIQLELERRSIRVEADATELRQLLANLVANGVEALRGQARRVLVVAGIAEVDADELSLYYLDDDLPSASYAFLEVVDEGVGMDSSTQSRMFEPFFSTKFVGRGLGLPAVLGIVRAHQGTLNVYSEPHRGTRVRVLLPLAEAAASHGREGEGPAEQDGVVVIADDDAAVRRVASSMLRSAGYRVLPARNGVEAVALVRDNLADVRGVLLDLSMPTMSGEETLRELEALPASVPVILSSGLADADARRCLASHDRLRFLQKPYQAADLLGALRGLAA
jgi:two-component system cell cycle sensor histidine kinase/response regulator CckA